ncbi:MAG: uncharacterized protein K0R15_1955 [Clostridiales bacterium]|jgi:hypothetical protein|nr:uncharacterized protein [Clostridiales bacterium]
MKRRMLVIILCIFMICNTLAVYADEGEMGPFGGITEGTNLPTMMEYNFTTNSTSTTKAIPFNEYKEIIFIGGTPVEVSGTMKLTKGDSKVRTSQNGTYTEKYLISAKSKDGTVLLNRTLDLIVSYENNGTVIKRDGKKSKWEETITVNGITYTLNQLESNFYKTSTENIKPGVSYYQTTTTYVAIYYNGTNKLEVKGDGEVYGYKQPWSKLETQKLTLHINNQESTKPWQMTVVVKPTLNAEKSIYFQKTSPSAISFDGTYNQRLEREATIKYEIQTDHPNLDEDLLVGGISNKPLSPIESLGVIPAGLDFLIGHWAEGDVRQLYSLGIMTETPSRNMLYQLTTRGEFVKQLCLGLKIDVDAYDDLKGTKPQIFRDVDYKNPYYKYVMAAYQTGISVGVGKENKFGVDNPITRQEAFALLVRTIGLERLGIGSAPRTPFIDDSKIDSWARKEIAAAYMLNIVAGNEKNELKPKANIGKMETAAIINRMLRYLRSDIATDYINME